MLISKGSPLKSRTRYQVTVNVWGNHGQEASLSSDFETALLHTSDWQAGWIGIDSALNATDRMEGDSRLAARYLRKPFDVEGKVKNARLYISGLGLYECYIKARACRLRRLPIIARTFRIIRSM